MKVKVQITDNNSGRSTCVITRIEKPELANWMYIYAGLSDWQLKKIQTCFDRTNLGTNIAPKIIKIY